MEAVLARGEDDEVNPFDVSFALVEAEEDEDEDDGGGGGEAEARGAESSERHDGGPTDAGSSSGCSKPASALLGGGAEARGRAEKPLSLAAINARLERYAMEHEWTSDGALADFGAVLARQTSEAVSSSGRPPSSSSAVMHRHHHHHAAAAAAAVPAATPAAGGAAATRSCISAGGRSTATVAGQRDYLREARQVKELAERCGFGR